MADRIMVMGRGEVRCFHDRAQYQREALMRAAQIGFRCRQVGSDLLELLLAAARPGGLAEVELEWSPQWAVTLVLASAGYPESSSKGDLIVGLEQLQTRFGDARAESVTDRGQVVEVTHAGTARTAAGVVTAGGRVLNVTALGADPDSARDAAYAAAEMISFDGMQLRHDIAAHAAEA